MSLSLNSKKSYFFDYSVDPVVNLQFSTAGPRGHSFPILKGDLACSRLFSGLKQSVQLEAHTL